MAAAAAAAWPVCTICYEDLRPLSDQHLHCLPSCGHVFHALCLEQWLEYCPGGKRKLTCPICKQACAAGRAPTRLYFQSTGAGPTQSLPEAASADADPEAVAAEVARLQQKAASFSKVVEEQRAVIQKLKAEVVRWREQAAEEEVKHESIRKDKEYVQQMLIVKTEELLRKTSECTRLQEKSLALAKELAALKLSTDTNLEEEEILKLASLGNYGKLEHACDVLKRSLALRNKSYKELMARCNILGRSESRAQLKLDKSKEQIKKLKTRVQELEKEFEEKENQALRDLRFLKKLKTDRANSSQCPTAGIGNQTMGPDEMLLDPDTSTFSCNDRPHLNQCLNVPKVNGDLNSKSTIDNKNVNVIDLDADTSAFVDKNDMGFFPNQFENFNNASEFRRQPSLSEHKNKESTTSSLVAEDTSYSKYTVGAMKSALPHNLMKNTEKNLQESPIDGSATVTTSTLTIAGISKKATSLASGTGPQQIYNANSFSDDFQMPAGTLGAEGAKKSISKWCKGFTTPVSLNVNAARNSRNLISVGPDGRGGKVKVLRDLGPFQDSKTQTLWPKTQKLGGRGGQCQIDHFFGRR